MSDEKPIFIIRFFMFFIDLFYGFFNRISGMIVNIILVYALGYFGLMYYLNANPDKKEMFEQKKTALLGMMSQTSALLQAQQNGELPEGVDAGALENISHLITPEMMQMAMSIMGGDKNASNEAIPAKNIDLSSLKTTDPNSIPAQLKPIDEIFQRAKSYTKIRPQFTVARAGTDGAKAVPTLERLLKNKNQTIAEAAYVSLRLIGTQAAVDVLHKHGY